MRRPKARRTIRAAPSSVHSSSVWLYVGTILHFFVCVPRIVGIPFGFSVSPEQARSEAYVLIAPICSACLNGLS